MKQLLTILIVFSIAGSIYSQEEGELGVPAAPSFSAGGDIQGTIQNSVNESTGKVVLSAPLASISASSVSYSVGLTYNGQASFKSSQQNNKYNPTSIVGVGWSMSTPKIVVDNKGTGARDDDDFYLIDGTTKSKLICINRGTTSNGSQWEFQLEKYAPWKIYFYHHNGWGDYWKVIKDDGLTYYFGNSSTKEGKEFEVRYGNWIGSSKRSGATSEHTIVWNITKIEDQWLNNITFTYDMVKQTMSGKDQTEASYLTEVTSSNGASIQLIYGTKTLNEYYEPHKESAEPDAYQERYEKKYLQKVMGYNNANQLVSTYNLGYTLNGTGLNTKRYMTSLTQTAYKDGVSETLPAQTFEYNYTGTFKGGLKEVSYPTGGSVTYSYNEKLLFNNQANIFQSPFVLPYRYQYHSSIVKDNYSLYILRTKYEVTPGKYRYKIFRVWWNGMAWEHEDYTFPHLMTDYVRDSQGYTPPAMENFYLVAEDNFYGLMYDIGASARVYLFHLKNDGRTWHSYTSTYKDIGSENPQFVSGNGFVGLQSHRGGELYTYVWNGNSWNYKLISQGSGQYYIAATNNFIVSLDEDGGADMKSGVSYQDNYYIHYLDVEGNWQTKSWSSAADPYIAQISNASYWYPDNSIIGFMADNNPELFFRWDTNYNLTNIDNVLGGFDDIHPMVPVGNSLFTIYGKSDHRPYKSARFNGVAWSLKSLETEGSWLRGYPQFDNDFIAYVPENTGPVKYHSYNPNTNNWMSDFLGSQGSSSVKFGANPEFFAGGSKFYQRSNTGVISEIGSYSYADRGFATDGREKFLMSYGGRTSGSSYLFYLDKVNGQVKEITFNNQNSLYNASIEGMNFIQENFSYRTLWLKADQDHFFYRLIDNETSFPVNDIVVNHIDINDDNGFLRKIQYTFNNPKSLADNSSTFYGEVIIENKGTGTGNRGKIVKRFNDGATDLTMVGLPLEVLTIDADNKAVKRVTTTWKKYSKSSYNGSNYFYSSYYIRPTTEKEELFFENSPKMISTTTHSYNSYGLKTATTRTDSKGESIRESTSYAYQYYPFVKDKNMLSFPYQTTTNINGQVVNVEQTKWISDNGKVYINENWSGPSTNTLRVNSQISKVLSNGTVVESNNGKGIYSAAVFGYDHLYEVATVSNATYQEILNELDVTYAQLQTLSASNLKMELLKLYSRLPNAAISLSFYDNNGRVISRINERKEESFIYYDTLGRMDYITDAQGNILEKKNYHFTN